MRLQAEISAPTGCSLPPTPTCMGIPSRPLPIQDPFGDKLKKLMDRIHNRLEMPELSQDYGTQNYEQQVVELSRAGERGRPRGAGGGVGARRPGPARVKPFGAELGLSGGGV